ncbi:MAG: FimB/Mfa2 family fimbrial subunit [Muribaculaceae bacterium]|nr:FimB/Mfa2 family fimbrial subunit [Muribaculaceae bacterium]
MYLKKLKPVKGVALFAAGFLALTLSSCDNSFVYEDLRACIPEYKIRLSYDHNMAFTQQNEKVEAAEIYAFDPDGNLATVVTADKQTLIDNKWTLPITLERNKTYDIVVWGGLVSNSPFSLDGTRAVSSKEDVTCRLITEADGTSSKEFPALFHGIQSVTYTVEDGPETMTVPLKKNTNTVDVAIRKETGEVVEDGYYVVEITDANGVMDHQNNVSGSQVKYNPVSFTSTELPLPNGQGGEQAQTSQAGVSQFHVARLMENSDARIKIFLKESGIKLVDMKLIDLILAAKASEAPDMNPQEYLDRQDTYKLDFTLRIEEDWSVFEIYVNNWIVVINDIEWK